MNASTILAAQTTVTSKLITARVSVNSVMAEMMKECVSRNDSIWAKHWMENWLETIAAINAAQKASESIREEVLK